NSARGKFLQNPLLQVVFGERLLRANLFRGFIKRSANHAIDDFSSGEMRLQLRRSPARFELLDEVGRADDFRSRAAHQFDRSPIATYGTAAFGEYCMATSFARPIAFARFFLNSSYPA